MKKTAILLLAAAASFSYAHAADVERFVTAERQTITLGDTVEEMQARMKASPMSVNSQALSEGGQKAQLAIDYTYEIENMRYVITVINDRINKIQTESLNK